MRYILFFAFCITSIYSASSQVTKHPLLVHSTAEDIRITEIANVQEDYSGRHVTLVKMEYAPRQNERFMIPPGMYINDAKNPHKRYELIGFADNTHFVGKWYPGNLGQLYQFTILFEGIDDCITTINIYEPEIINTVTWLWKDITINNYCNGRTTNAIADNFAPIIPSSKEEVIEATPLPVEEPHKKTKTEAIGW